MNERMEEWKEGKNLKFHEMVGWVRTRFFVYWISFFFLSWIRFDSIRMEVTGWLICNAVRSEIAGLVIWGLDGMGCGGMRLNSMM